MDFNLNSLVMTTGDIASKTWFIMILVFLVLLICLCLILIVYYFLHRVRIVIQCKVGNSVVEYYDKGRIKKNKKTGINQLHWLWRNKWTAIPDSKNFGLTKRGKPVLYLIEIHPDKYLVRNPNFTEKDVKFAVVEADADLWTRATLKQDYNEFSDERTFWDKYGNWILTITLMIIILVIIILTFKFSQEVMAKSLSQAGQYIQQAKSGTPPAG